MLSPLAERLRPRTLEGYIGQSHLVGPNGIITKLVLQSNLPSMIFWGPPGVGKTTLANIIANTLNRPFYSLSAINSGVKDVRETIELAKGKGLFAPTKRPVLFIDEIHRFSKSQQDALLQAVEKGIITLIGATTENPSFEVISALLSRCQVYTLYHLSEEDLLRLVHYALKEDEILKLKNIEIIESDALIRYSGGDARKLYNILEILDASFTKPPFQITNELVTSVLQQNLSLYDKSGEQHYDIISAFIKSVRGSDPNAALFWMARMIEGGEDPLFICRRLIILAAEDIGLANPNALLLANQCFMAVQVIGMPEGRIIMSETALYLATSPKSNSAYMAIEKAIELVKQYPNAPVPLHLRNAPTKFMKESGYGKDYVYSHQGEDNFHYQEFMPEQITDADIYSPCANPNESKIKEWLQKRWKSKYKF